MDKIDIRDLRGGNWVRITEPDNFAGAMVKISSFSNQEGANFAVTVDDPEFGYYTREVFCEDIEPILITKEILEKNGFIKKDENYYRYFLAYDENYYFGFESITYDTNTCFINVTKEGHDGIQSQSKCICKYLHQLQNILRDLGIDKEITI